LYFWVCHGFALTYQDNCFRVFLTTLEASECFFEAAGAVYNKLAICSSQIANHNIRYNQVTTLVQIRKALCTCKFHRHFTSCFFQKCYVKGNHRKELLFKSRYIILILRLISGITVKPKWIQQGSQTQNCIRAALRRKMSPRPQIKMKKALQAALWSPKYRDMLNYFKNGLVWSEIDCEMRKKTKKCWKYANIITNLQYIQFMKEVTGCTSTSGGPHAARGPRVWDRWNTTSLRE